MYAGELIERASEFVKAVSDKVREGYAVVSQDGFAYQAVNDTQTDWVTNDGSRLNESLKGILVHYAVGMRRFAECLDEYEVKEFAEIVTRRISDIAWD